MILLNKKRILFILSSVVISIFSITTPSTIPVNSVKLSFTLNPSFFHGFNASNTPRLVPVCEIPNTHVDALSSCINEFALFANDDGV